jgi:hypothetical protein
MLCVRFPLSIRNVEDLLHERGIEVSRATVRFWWQRFGLMFAAEIRKRRVSDMPGEALDQGEVRVLRSSRMLELDHCAPQALRHALVPPRGPSSARGLALGREWGNGLNVLLPERLHRTWTR